MPSGVARRQVDAVFDDDVTLRQYVGDALALSLLPGPAAVLCGRDGAGQPYACSISSIGRFGELRHEHPEIPDAFNRKTVAHVGRREEAEADDARAVPDMDRSIDRIRKRGKLRVGIHPGVEGLCTVTLRQGSG